MLDSWGAGRASPVASLLCSPRDATGTSGFPYLCWQSVAAGVASTRTRHASKRKRGRCWESKLYLDIIWIPTGTRQGTLGTRPQLRHLIFMAIPLAKELRLFFLLQVGSLVGDGVSYCLPMSAQVSLILLCPSTLTRTMFFLCDTYHSPPVTSFQDFEILKAKVLRDKTTLISKLGCHLGRWVFFCLFVSKAPNGIKEPQEWSFDLTQVPCLSRLCTLLMSHVLRCPAALNLRSFKH